MIQKIYKGESVKIKGWRQFLERVKIGDKYKINTNADFIEWGRDFRDEVLHSPDKIYTVKRYTTISDNSLSDYVLTSEWFMSDKFLNQFFIKQ